MTQSYSWDQAFCEREQLIGLSMRMKTIFQNFMFPKSSEFDVAKKVQNLIVFSSVQNFMLPRVTERAPFWKPLEWRQENKTGLNSFVLRFSSPSSSRSV